MKVIIVGAGLGGLACAIACRQEGLDVVVLEKSQEVEDVGAGIQVPPNGTRIMMKLGLLPKLLELGQQVQQVDFRRYDDGRIMRTMPFGEDIIDEFKAPWLIIHRADYHRVLFDEATRLGANVRMGASVENISPDGPIVILDDGEKVCGDVVVGADGIGSITRRVVTGDTASLVPTGDSAYRATFKKEQLEALADDQVDRLCKIVGVTSWLGPDQHTIFYPVRGGNEFNLVLLRPDNLSQGTNREKADVHEMQESYANWDPVLRKIILCVPFTEKWRLSNLPELSSWSKGPVVLIGDACHPTLPYQAQGAAMAVEDGAIIGKLLGLLQNQYQKGEGSPLEAEKPDQGAIISVLSLFEKLRKKRTTRNVQGAIKNRKLFHVKDGIVSSVRNFALRYAGVTRKSDRLWFSSHRMKKTLVFDSLANSQKVWEKKASSKVQVGNRG